MAQLQLVFHLGPAESDLHLANRSQGRSTGVSACGPSPQGKHLIASCHCPHSTTVLSRSV